MTWNIIDMTDGSIYDTLTAPDSKTASEMATDMSRTDVTLWNMYLTDMGVGVFLAA